MMELHRRRFLQMAGSASLFSLVGGRLGWAAPTASVAYVGTADAIRVYSIFGGFFLKQTIASEYPVAMAISRGKLYVANGVSEFANLPRGSVEAYAIDPTTGRLELMNRMPLSLSAIAPRDLAVSPDGRSVIVAVHGGGAYNVLPLEQDGRLGRVSGILKEIGSGPHPRQGAAHPSAVMFDHQGRVLAADQGSDRLNVLALHDGALTVRGRFEVAAGSGPSSMVLHPSGRRIYVAHAFDGSVASFAYEPTGMLYCTQSLQASAVGEGAALAIHPSGDMLYSSHGQELHTWRIAADGGLRPSRGVEGVRATKLHVTADGQSLFALSPDAVLRMDIEAATHLPRLPVEVASPSNPLSIAAC